MSTAGEGSATREGTVGSRSRRRAAVGLSVSALLLAGIAYGGWRLLHTPARTPAAICPSATPTVAATVPTVGVRVLNGTARRGLAGQTASLLRQRGFRIAGVGNGPRVPGRSQIRYGAAEILPARLTALQVPNAVLVADRGVTKRVDIVLGSTFGRLRTPAEVAAAARSARLAAPRPASSVPCR